MSLIVVQTRDEFLVIKQPWPKCSNRWSERLWEREREKNSSRWEQKILSSLCIWSSRLWRCVVLGAKGHLRWQKNRETEREWIILAAGLQNACHGLASIAKGLWLWKDKERNAYHQFIMLAFKEDSNMAMRCFPCLGVQPACLSECKSVWLFIDQLLTFYPDYQEKMITSSWAQNDNNLLLLFACNKCVCMHLNIEPVIIY